MKNAVILVLIVVMVSWQGIILAESPESKKSLGKAGDVYKIDVDILSFKERIMFDTRYILNSPRRMGTKGRLTWATILATAGIMYSKKEDIREWIQDNTTSSTDDISKVVRPLGSRVVVPAIASSFYLEGLLLHNSKSKETGVMLMESFCYTAIMTLAGQYIFAEERPDEGGEMHLFKTSGHGISGHAAFASCIAGSLNRQYLQIKDVDSNSAKLMKYSGKAAVYGLPVLTGLSRLNDDKHYSWNVFLGLALGYTIGELVADAHMALKKRDIAVMPFVDDREKGIVVSIRF